MKSNNPVFNRSEEFNRASSNAYGNQTYAGGGQAYPGYGDTSSDPSTWGTGTPGQVDDGRMTVDSVVQKTAISIALVFVTAFITWWWIGDVSGTDAETNTAASRALALAGLGAGAAFLLSLVNSFKQVISPALVLAFAAVEGVALGAISKVFETQFAGIVTSAVLGTFGAFAGTLAAYKFFDIKVGDKFRRGVIAGMFGMVGLGLLSMVLSFFGINTGLYGMRRPRLHLRPGRPRARCLHADPRLRLRRERRRCRPPGPRVVAGGLRPDRQPGLDLHQPAAHPRDHAWRLTARSDLKSAGPPELARAGRRHFRTPAGQDARRSGRPPVRTPAGQDARRSGR